jgi:hypothetical protein
MLKQDATDLDREAELARYDAELEAAFEALDALDREELARCNAELEAAFEALHRAIAKAPRKGAKTRRPRPSPRANGARRSSMGHLTGAVQPGPSAAAALPASAP